VVDDHQADGSLAVETSFRDNVAPAMDELTTIWAQGGGYGPPPGGYGPPPGGYAPPAGPPGGYGPPPQQFGPPGGMPAAPGGGPVPPDLQAHVQKWFTLSIVSIFCGCGLLGIINVLMANQAKEALARGDVATAQDKIKTARLLCILGYVSLALQLVLVAFWFVAGFASVLLSH
jgi:hypothetical protein